MEGERNTKKRNELEEVPEAESSSSIISQPNQQSSDESSSSNIFNIGKALSGRSTCKECKTKITKDSLRIGKLVPFKDTHITHFFHVDCAFQSFKRARVKLNIISETGDVDGAEILTSDEAQVLIDAIHAATAERTRILPDQIVQSTRKQVATLPPAHSRRSKLRSSNFPSMKILFTNADQLTGSKMCELITKINQDKPMIVAVSEDKMKHSTKKRSLEDYQTPSYTLHPVNLFNETGRGIAVYTHKSIDKSTVEIQLDNKFEESCILEIRLRGGDVMLFSCCYRSPTASETSEKNNEKLSQLFRTISNNKYTHRCVVGDFNFRNINWANWSTSSSENSMEYKFIEAARDSYFFQHITKPTRCRGKDNPSLIDLLFTDEEMNVSGIQHHAPLGKSDHNVITFEYHCYLDFSKPKDVFSYSKGDNAGMGSDMISSDWTAQHLQEANLQNVEEC